MHRRARLSIVEDFAMIGHLIRLEGVGNPLKLPDEMPIPERFEEMMLFSFLAKVESVRSEPRFLF
jgi:hypothetical protein